MKIEYFFTIWEVITAASNWVIDQVFNHPLRTFTILGILYALKIYLKYFRK